MARVARLLSRKIKVHQTPQTALTHSVGTADGTVDDVGAAFNQTTLNNNFKEITTALGQIRTILKDAGLTT